MVNSKKPKKRVAKGKVVVRKRKEPSPMADSFSAAWGYICEDILLPAAKDMISDAVSGGVDQILFGGERKTSRRKSHSSSSASFNYNSISSGRKTQRAERKHVYRSRGAHDLTQYILDDRRDAEDVIDFLFSCLQDYEVATVSDFKGAVGVSPTYTDENWGWTELRGARAVRVREGYIIDLPNPKKLD